ncbi:MAG: hypothetical protein IJT62_07465 [Oscillospiraceae bacterium]|nr:hypothetical protein [Oscillospiraceae bacterium]
MANPLMSIFSGMAGGNNSLLMQAVGAMMRGESPQDFMRNLANSRPELRNVDLNDINGSARRICQERGVDPDKLSAEIRQKLPK